MQKKGFIPTKTASGFNQGGFKFTKPSGKTIEKGKSNEQEPRSGLNSSQSNRKGARPMSQDTKQRRIDEVRIRDLVTTNKKGFSNPNPIIKQGGKEAFLRDVQKLKEAENVLSETLERLNQQQLTGETQAVTAKPQFVGPVIGLMGAGTGLSSNPLSSSALDSSQMSPVAESLHGGVFSDRINQKGFKLSPNRMDQGAMSQKTIEYSEEGVVNQNLNNTLLQQKETVDDNVQPSFFPQNINSSPISPINASITRNNPENQTLEHPQFNGPSASMQEVHQQIADDNFNNLDRPNPTVSNAMGRITPFELDKLNNSQEIKMPSQNQDGKSSQIYTQGPNDEQASNSNLGQHGQGLGTGGVNRKNILNKLRGTPQMSQQLKPQEPNPQTESVQQQFNNVVQNQEGSVQVILDKSLENSLKLTAIPLAVTADDKPLIEAQIDLYRKKLRENEQKIKATLGRSHSPVKETAQLTITQLKDLDSQWQPPEFGNIDYEGLYKTQDYPLQNIKKSMSKNYLNESSHRSRSPRRDIAFNQSFNETHPVPAHMHGRKTTTISVSLSQKLFNQQMNKTLQSSKGGGQKFLQEIPESNPMSPTLQMGSPRNQQIGVKQQLPSTQPIVYSPNVFNVGSLSQFEDQKTIIKGQFPQRGPGVNEQKFFKKNHENESPIKKSSKERPQRAMTASALNRAHKRNASQDSQTLRTSQGLRQNIERRPFSLNSTCSNWNAQQGKELERICESPTSSLKNAKENTVVLQATLLVGNQKHSYIYPMVEANERVDQSPKRILYQGPIPKSQGSIRNQVMFQSDQQKPIMKLGLVEVNKNSDFNVGNGVIHNIYTGIGEVSPIADGQETKKIGSPLSQTKEMIQGDGTTTNLNGRDFQQSDFSSCLQRRYEGQSFLTLHGQTQHLSSEGKSVSPSAKNKIQSRDQLNLRLQSDKKEIVNRNERSNSGSYQKKKTSNFAHQHRKNVLAKAKNYIVDVNQQQNNDNLGGQQTPALPMSRLDVSQTIQRGISFPNLTPKQIEQISHQVGGDSVGFQTFYKKPNESPSVVKLQTFAPVILSHDQSKGNLNSKKSKEISNFLAHKVVGNDDERVQTASTGFRFRAHYASLSNTIHDKNIRHQDNNQFSQFDGFGDYTSNVDLIKNKTQRSNVTPGSAGYITNGFKLNNGIRVNFQSNRNNMQRTSQSSRRSKIEFKILSMNLALPKSIDKNSNIMSCELDLSQHLNLKYRKQTQYSTTQQQTNNQLSKTLTLTSPKGITSSNKLLGVSMQQQPQNWQEIHQVRASLNGNLSKFGQTGKNAREIQNGFVIPTISQGSNRMKRNLGDSMSLQESQTQRSEQSRQVMQSRGVLVGGGIVNSNLQANGSQETKTKIQQSNELNNRNITSAKLVQTLAQGASSAQSIETTNDLKKSSERNGLGMIRTLVSNNSSFYQKKKSSRRNYGSPVQDNTPNKDIAKELLSQPTNPSVLNQDFKKDHLSNNLTRTNNYEIKMQSLPQNSTLGTMELKNFFKPEHQNPISSNTLDNSKLETNHQILQSMIQPSSHQKRSSILFKHQGGQRLVTEIIEKQRQTLKVSTD